MKNKKSIKTTVVDRNQSKHISYKVFQCSMKWLEKVYETIGICQSTQSDSRWSANQERDYLSSTFNSRAPSIFTLLDVNECLKNCNNKRERDYFNKFKKAGIRYLNHDSNNRTNGLIKFFFEGKSATHGETFWTERANGECVKWEVPEGSKFKDFSSEQQEEIKNTLKISVALYDRITDEQAKLLFLGLQRGTSLNSAEKRNAELSDICETIRNWASVNLKDQDTCNKKLNSMFTKLQLNRRGADSWAAWTAFHAMYGHMEKDFGGKLDEKKLMQVYQSGSKFDQDNKKAESVLDDFRRDWIDPHENLIADMKDGKKLNKTAVMDLCILTKWYDPFKNAKKEERSNLIKDYSDTFKRLRRKKTLFKTSEKGDRRFTFCGLYASTGSDRTEVRISQIVKELDKSYKSVSSKKSKIEVCNYNYDNGITPVELVV